MLTALLHLCVNQDDDEDGTTIVTFDGAVLEVFSDFPDARVRLHVAQLNNFDVKSEHGKSQLVADPDEDVFPLDVDDNAVVAVMELAEAVQKAIAAYHSQ